MQVKTYMRELGRGARAAARELARANTAAKDRALGAMAAQIRSRAKEILAANAADARQAKKAGRDAAFVDRLTMNAKSVEQMAEGVEQVAGLEDPVGAISERVKRPTATRIAAALERDGLIERASDPSDGRACLLSTSREGKALIKRVRSRKNAYISRRLRKLGDEDVETLERAAEVLERMLEDPS